MGNISKIGNQIGNYQYNIVYDIIWQGGTTCIVYKARSSKSQPGQVAIKILKAKINQLSIQQYMSIVEQLNLRKTINSRGIVQFYDWQQFQQQGAPKQIALIMQLMDGSLKTLIKTYSVGTCGIPQQTAKQFLKLIVDSYKQLHKIRIQGQKIIHKSLNPDKILFRKSQQGTFTIKISDVGLKRLQNLSISTPFEQGTKHHYISPQQAKQDVFTTKADVYAIGTIFFEMLCGYSNTPIKLGCVKWQSRQTDFIKIGQILKNINVSNQSILFIQQCLEYQQDSRLSWQQVFDNAIFEKICNPLLQITNVDPKKIYEKLSIIRAFDGQAVRVINDRFTTAIIDTQIFKYLANPSKITQLQIFWCQQMNAQTLIKILDCMPKLEQFAMVNYRQNLPCNFIEKLSEFNQLESFYIRWFSQHNFYQKWNQDEWFIPLYDQICVEKQASIQDLLKLSKLKQLQNIQLIQINDINSAQVIKNIKALKHLTLGAIWTQQNNMHTDLIREVCKQKELRTLSLIGITVSSTLVNKLIVSNNHLRTIIVRNAYSNQNIDDETIECIANNLVQLQNLCVCTNTALTAKHLSKLDSLVMLQIYNCKNISKKELIEALKKLQKLQHLSLRYNLWVDDEVIMGLQSCVNLTYLNIYRTSVSGQGLKHLKGLDLLKILICGQTNIDGKSLIKLTKHIQSIRRLSIINLEVSDDDLLQISCNCLDMTHLDIRDTAITVDALLKMQQLKVVMSYLSQESLKRLTEKGIYVYS